MNPHEVTMPNMDLEKTNSIVAQGSPQSSIRDEALHGQDTPEHTNNKHTLTDWDSPEDPGKPWNWPLTTRIYGIAVPAWYALSVTLGTSIYAPGISDVEAKYHVSRTASIVGISIYSLGLAFGPVLAAPISETWGRKWVYLVSMPVFLLFTAGVGLAKNFGTILVCRFFAAAFGAPALAVGAGTVADLWNQQAGGAVAGSFFIMMPFLGSALGPLVGAYIIEVKHSYSWTMWVLMAVSGPAWIASFLLPETSHKILLQRRALQRGMAPPPKPPPKQAMKLLLTVTLLRPLHMLLFEPIIGFISLYVAFTFGILFAFFDTFPYVFVTVYHFSLGQTGLTYLGIIVGIISAVASFAVIDKTLYARALGRVTEHGKIPPPEQRLYSSMMGSFLITVSLFWFAWTARPSVHWIVPILAAWPFGWGLLSLFLGTTCYLVDGYQSLNAASANAANGLLRYVFGAAFPLFTVQMLERLGIDWSMSLLGFISILLLPIPWILFRWGAEIRKRSAYKMGNFQET